MSRSLRVAVVALVVFAVTAPGANPSATLAIRPARVADDVSLSPPGWQEDWRILALDPRTHGYALIDLTGGPLPSILVSARSGSEEVGASVELGNGRLPHDGPGLTIANVPGPGAPQRNSLSYVRDRYVVDLTYPVRGHLTIVPRRPGVTVGPWQLGPETFYPGNVTVQARMFWSAVVATGSISGWLETDGHRIDLHDWRAYHDHIWGRFRRVATSWTHWDFVLRTPRPGEAWILNGLEPTNGAFTYYPHDDRWQGVLVHVTPGGSRACLARITRRAWREGWHQNTPWTAPTLVSARCRTASDGLNLAVQAPDQAHWPTGGFYGGIGGSAPLADGTGWIEHGQPLMPNT
jgi:hypothetical protein